MSQESHDHNFKNLFADFPKEALEWILPEAAKIFGAVLKIEFVRQEPKKRRLSDAHLAHWICRYFSTLKKVRYCCGWSNFRKTKTGFRFTNC